MENEEKEEFFGKVVEITGPVVHIDGTTMEDYTWEEHLYFLGFALSDEKKDER